MARRAALPGGALETLMDEARPRPAPSGKPRRAAARTAPVRGGKASRSSRGAAIRGTIPRESRAAARDLGDPVARYAASRGVMPHGGPMEVARLAFQMAVDVREVAKKERVGVITVVARALAGYLSDKD